MAHRVAEGRTEWSRRDYPREENGRVLVQLDHQKGGRTVAVTHDHLSGLPPSSDSSRGSQEQASSPQTRRAGAQRHDRAPVTPSAAPPPPHVKAAVLTLVGGTTVVVVCSAGLFARPRSSMVSAIGCSDGCSQQKMLHMGVREHNLFRQVATCCTYTTLGKIPWRAQAKYLKKHVSHSQTET